MAAASISDDTAYLCVMESDSDKSFEGFEWDKIEQGEDRVCSSMTRIQQTVYDRDIDDDFAIDIVDLESDSDTDNSGADKDDDVLPQRPACKQTVTLRRQAQPQASCSESWRTNLFEPHTHTITYTDAAVYTCTTRSLVT